MISFRLSMVVTAGLLAVPILAGTGHAEVTEANFISKTTGDLAALCSAPSTDRFYTAAINFCHGFGAGAYGMLASAQQADPQLSLFCAPPGLTRDEAVKAFISWVGSDPDRMALPAVDGIAAFLTTSYPCAATPTQRSK